MAAFAVSVAGCTMQEKRKDETPAAIQQQTVLSFNAVTPKLYVETKTEPVKLTEAQQKALNAFNEKLNAAKQLANQKKFTEALQALQPLTTDQSVAPAERIRAKVEMVSCFQRDQKFDNALRLNKEIIADKTLTPRSKVLPLLNEMQIYQQMREYENAAMTGFRILSECELTQDEVRKYRNEIILNFSHANKLETAISLSRELINMPDTPENEKITLLANISEYYRRDKKFDEAVANDEALLQRPGISADVRAAAMNRMAASYMQMTPPKQNLADRICEELIADSTLPMHQRINALAALTNRMTAKAEAVDKWKALAAVPEINVNDFIRIQQQIIQLTKNTPELSSEMLKAAEAILARPDASNGQKIAATWTIGEYYALNDRMEGAMAVVKEPLKYEKLTTGDVIAIYKNIGKLYEWQENPKEAMAAYREILKTDSSDNTKLQVNRLLTACMIYFGDIKGAAKIYHDEAMFLDEARVYINAGYIKEGQAAALKVLANENAAPAERCSAYEFFVEPDHESRAVMEKYLPVYLASRGGGVFFQKTRFMMYDANYEFAARLLEIAIGTSDQKNNFFAHLYYMNSLTGLGKFDVAAKVALAGSSNMNFKLEERYRFALCAAMLQAPEVPGEIQKLFNAVDAKSADRKELSQKQISDTLLQVARTAMIGNKQIAAKDVYKLYDSMFVPEPKKLYTVKFSDTPITGIASWNAMPNKPQKQAMDRKYGGNMDFLITDVSTGNRGAGIGSDSAATKKYGEFSAVCDAYGIHFLFTAYDDRAREVEAKLLGAGSYEIYFAAGENQPYICLLPDLQSGKTGIWQSTYDNETYRRVLENSPYFRTEHRFSDTGYTTYLFFGWDFFYDKLPDPGDLWDFENIHWGRDGGFAWNGTKTIHGRSTWGHLAFDMTDAQRTLIKRQLIFKALAEYNSEKATSGRKEGVIDHWKDAELGDPEFYAACVAPYVAKLDAYLPLVKMDMSDVDVKKVFSEAVPHWNEIRFKIADMRRKYLEEKLSN